MRPHSIAEVKEYAFPAHCEYTSADTIASSIARSAGNLILQNGGVVRGYTNWGVYALPKPMQNRSETKQPSSNEPVDPYAPKLSNKHTVAHYFIMRFDSNARTQHTLRKTWSADPRLLRFSVVKLGEKLGEIADVGGKAEEWMHIQGHEGERRANREGTIAEEIRKLNGMGSVTQLRYADDRLGAKEDKTTTW